MVRNRRPCRAAYGDLFNAEDFEPLHTYSTHSEVQHAVDARSQQIEQHQNYILLSATKPIAIDSRLIYHTHKDKGRHDEALLTLLGRFRRIIVA